MAMRDILDIKPALPLAGQWDWAWYALLGLGLAAAVLAVGHWWTRPRQREKRSLRRALNRLKTDAAGLDDRAFAYRLADLLRQALAWRTAIPAPSMTSEEILARLPASALPSPLQRAMADTLSRIDPARYADAPFPTFRAGGGNGIPPAGAGAAPRPPQASSPSRPTDLDTIGALLGRGWS